MNHSPEITEGIFLKANEETLDKIIQQGEARLQAQVETAQFRDQRAMTVAAAAIALASAGFAFSGFQLSNGWQFDAIRLASLIFAVCLFICAGLCLWAARPGKLYLPGSPPIDWTDNIINNDDQKTIKAEMAKCLHISISKNEEIAKQINAITRISLVLFLLSPIISIFVWIFIKLWN